ncbi:MAG: peptidyl-prolyl cis-trans isomerase [Betaproteobacteria bacterium]|nr:peptidyl-prolyl cis-trans isomerase [Betaproteobacteria bacterium]
MFDFVRTHKKIMQFLLVLLIFPAFVLVGIDGYNKFIDKGTVVATVNGVDILQAEWDNAHRLEVERFRAQAPGLDPKLLESDQARYGTLERLVRDRVLVAASRQQWLSASDQRLAEELMQNPTIAALRKPDGSVDKDRYRQLLAAQGLTPEMFEANVRTDLAARQVVAVLGSSSLVGQTLANVTLDAFYEKREVQVARFLAADQLAQIKTDEAALLAYYNANTQRFRSAEKADVQYAVLDLTAIEKTITLNEQDVKTYFEQNQERLSNNIERRASHILIAAGKDAPAAEREKAKTTAQGLRDTLQKSPQQFAELAKKYSQDPGSAAKGGDLDFFGRGAMVKPFEDAAFSLKKGEISPLVETEFGYHIIQITDVKTPQLQSFAQARAGFESELRREQARKKFAEAAEQFTNLVYEQSDSLKPVADRLKLDIQSSQGVGRTPNPGDKGPLANPKVLAALFSADATEKMRNTEAIEFGPYQMVSVRVVKHYPENTLPLAQVKERVTGLWKADQALKLAKQEALAKMADGKADKPVAGLGAVQTLSREQSLQLPSEVVEAVMRAPAQNLPAWVEMGLGNLGHVLVKINKVVARDASDATPSRKDERGQLTRWLAAAESVAYYNDLKDRLKVKIKVPEPKQP